MLIFSERMRFSIRVIKANLIADLFDGSDLMLESKLLKQGVRWLGWPVSGEMNLVEDKNQARSFREQHQAEETAEEFFRGPARYGEHFTLELVEVNSMIVIRRYDDPDAADRIQYED